MSNKRKFTYKAFNLVFIFSKGLIKKFYLFLFSVFNSFFIYLKDLIKKFYLFLFSVFNSFFAYLKDLIKKFYLLMFSTFNLFFIYLKSLIKKSDLPMLNFLMLVFNYLSGLISSLNLFYLSLYMKSPLCMSVATKLFKLALVYGFALKVDQSFLILDYVTRVEETTRERMLFSSTTTNETHDLLTRTGTQTLVNEDITNIMKTEKTTVGEVINGRCDGDNGSSFFYKAFTVMAVLTVVVVGCCVLLDCGTVYMSQ